VDSLSEQPTAEVDKQPEVVESGAEGHESTAIEPTSTEESTDDGSESFFDPNQVPEELKPAYKQMQAAFTKKTQEIANQRREAEEYRQKAESLSKYEQYIPIIEEMLNGQSTQQSSPEMVALEQQLKNAGYSDEAIEMMKIGADFTLRQFNQTQALQREQERLTSQITEAANVDSRLNDTTLVYDLGDGQQATFGQIVEEMVAADPAWKQDPVAATRRAVKKVDALIGKAKTEGKEELSASAKAKAAKFPQHNSSPQSTAKTDQKMTVQEAFKAAKEELNL
jgi:hypothetical protein